MISVVIPLYNKEITILNCLRSVVRQLGDGDEVVIVNDGSTDSSAVLAKNYMDDNPTVKFVYVDQENCGVSVARNNGVSLASNNFVAFLDADDEWLPNYLSEMKSLIYDFPEASFFSSYFEFNDFHLGRYVVKSPLPSGYRGYVDDYFKVAQKTYVVNSSTVVLRKSSLEFVGGFPDGVAINEDLLVWFKMAVNFKFAHVNKVLVRVNRFQDNSRSGRHNSVPYLVQSYASDRRSFYKLSRSSRNYLRGVYRDHVLSSLSCGNKTEAVMRVKCGSVIFPISASLLLLLCVFPTALFVLLKKMRAKF